jgi:hypothetical protein
MYSANDVKWIKNVKRSKGTEWAYMEYEQGDSFYLNWSKHFKSNAQKPKNGEIVLLFQSVKKGITDNPGTYLTHLVTPIENKVGYETGSTHPYTRLVGVVARPKNPIFSLYHDLNMFKPNRGACCSIDLIGNILGKKELSLEQKQRKIWELFGVKNDLQDLFQYITSGPTQEEGVLEGKERFELRKHKFYERDPSIVKKAKRAAIEENRLFCEVCHLNFEFEYPEIGKDFIECHHKTHLQTGQERITKTSDLALVCSSCHRMLHRKLNGNYPTVEELKEIYLARKTNYR